MTNLDATQHIFLLPCGKMRGTEMEAPKKSCVTCVILTILGYVCVVSIIAFIAFRHDESCGIFEIIRLLINSYAIFGRRSIRLCSKCKSTGL